MKLSLVKNTFFSTVLLFQVSTAYSSDIFSNERDTFGGGSGEELVAIPLSTTAPIMATYVMLDACNGPRKSERFDNCELALTTAGALQISSYASLILIILAKSENTRSLIEKSERESGVSPELRSIILDAQELLKNSGKDFSEEEVLTVLESLN